VACALWCATARADETAADLAAKATDPTAALMSFGFNANYVGDYYGAAASGQENDSTTLSFRPGIPFKAFGTNNILRITLPYLVDGRGTKGLGDVSLFDVVTSSHSWGRLAVGGVAQLASSDSAPDPFMIGPAIGMVKPLGKKLNVGVFSQNLFAGHTAVSQLQPIAAYQLGGGWSLSAGDLQFTYDWKNGRWINLPIGAQLGKVVRLGSQPARWSINPQYNLRDSVGLSSWSVTLSLSLLVPGGN
jgi:hypothetical protein